MKSRPEYDLKIIGENLRRLRRAKSLTVEDVRKYLRLSSVQAIYKYEEGKGYPQVDTMFALMELYEANLADIINKHNDILCNHYEERNVTKSVLGRYSILYNNELFELICVDSECEQMQYIRLKNYYELKSPLKVC